MKKSLTIRWLTFLLIVLISHVSFGQHFTTVWTGNPYQSMAFIIQSATIDGVNMEAGDEIAVFDVTSGGTSICVGTVVLTGVVTSGSSASFPAAHEELVGDGFITGNTIIFKLWDNSESTEITMVIPTYFGPPFDEVYSPQGTALVTLLAGSSSVESTASSVTTCQGSVTVPIDVSNVNNVTELTLILDYGTTNLSYTGYQNANTQLNSGSLSVNESSGEITVTWNSTTAANITSGTLLEFLFTASTVYSQATENLTWDATNSFYIDSNGDTLQATFNNGIVTINPIPVDAGAITGTTPICQGTTGEGYQVGAITNATSYVWALSPTTAGTINGSGTSITVDFSGTYSGSASISVYGSNSCGNGTSSSLPITVIAHPTVGAGNDVSICEDVTHTLSGAATDQQSVLWSTSGDGSFDDATLLGATYTLGSNDISSGTTTLTLTAYAISPCSPDVTDDMVITIQALPTSDAGTNATICEDATHTLSGTATNQQSILWTSSGDGTFDNDASLTATYTPGVNDKSSGSSVLTLTALAITPCGTNATDDITLTIQTLPSTTAGNDATICDGNTYTLSGTAADQQSVLWTTNGDGSFDDATLLAATYNPGTNDISAASVVLTITAYAIAPCGTDATDDMTLSIQYQPTTGAGTDATICENNTYTLSGTSTNQQSILWTTSGDGSFDDATILAATYTPGSSDISTGNATLTITAYAITPCGTDAVDNMILTITLLPIASAGADESICETNPVYTLSGTASNQTSILWTGGDGSFDDANLLNATYTAGTNDLLTGSVTLTITAYPNAPCAIDAVDNMLLTYAPLPTANAGLDEEICLNAPSYQISGASATDYTALLWTTSGDGTFDDATLLNPVYTPGTNDRASGTVDLTLTASSVALCVDDDTMTLTFAVLPTADAGADEEICEDNTYQLSGTATDYSSTGWTTSGDGLFDDNTSLTAIYTPGPTDISSGTVNLTLTAYASLPCTDDEDDTMVLSIALLPIANAGPDDEICLSTPSYFIGNATVANQSSLLWTTAGDGTFDDATLVNPTYTLGANDITNFSVVLTMTAYAVTPCIVDDVDDMLLEFALTPTSDAGIDAEICEDNTYQLSGTATDYSSLGWTTDGDGTFDDNTSLTAIYTPGPTDISSGTANLTLTAYANLPCAVDAVDDMILSISLLPIANAGPDEEICLTDPEYYLVNATAANQSSVLWSTSGDGTFDDNTLVNPTYYPGPTDIANFSVTLTITAYATSPCATDDVDDMLLEFSLMSTSNAGDDDDVCESDSYMLNGTATNYDHVYWSTSGDGTFNDVNLLNATYTPGTGDISAGSVNLTMYAYGLNPCTGEVSDVMTLSITNLPTVSAGDDGETCESESYLLDGSAENYTNVNWTTSGDGTFDNPTLLASTYTPGTVDISSGMVDLTLTAAPNSPCTGDVSDIMMLSINYIPEKPSLPDGPIAVDLDATLTSEYTTNEVTYATSYQWNLEPVDAGTIEGSDIIGTVTWEPGFTGLTAYVSVLAINDCGEVSSDTLGVSVSPVGINHTSSNDPDITISPNPSNGTFNISISGATDDIDLFIMNSSGQIIHQEKLINTVGNSIHNIDISSISKGSYYLKFVTEKSILFRKVLTK